MNDELNQPKPVYYLIPEAISFSFESFEELAKFAAEWERHVRQNGGHVSNEVELRYGLLLDDVGRLVYQHGDPKAPDARMHRRQICLPKSASVCRTCGRTFKLSELVFLTHIAAVHGADGVVISEESWLHERCG